MTARDAVIAKAKSWVNYLEKRDGNTAYLWTKDKNVGSNNYTCFAYEVAKTKIFNGSKQGMPWCTTFIAAIINSLYGEVLTRKATFLPEYSSGAGCYYWVRYYQAAGKYGSTPSVGAQIFFRDSDGDPCHTGLVYAYDSTYVYTIEGNTSSTSSETVIANGGGVFYRQYSRSNTRIHGYGYIDYSVLGDAPDPTPGKEAKLYGKFKPYRNGSTPETVYRDTDLTDRTGLLNPNEECYCIGRYGAAYLVCYQLDGYADRWAVGYVSYNGGVSDD